MFNLFIIRIFACYKKYAWNPKLKADERKPIVVQWWNEVLKTQKISFHLVPPIIDMIFKALKYTTKVWITTSEFS